MCCIPRSRKNKTQSSCLPIPPSMGNYSYERLGSLSFDLPAGLDERNALLTAVRSHNSNTNNSSCAMAPHIPQSFAGSQLAAQHERLILELLPFKDAPQFQSWLQSDYVRGSWAEFRRDFLASPAGAPGSSSPRSAADPDKAKTAQAAKDAFNSRKPKFLVYHPNKTGWSPEDHHVRFIVTIVGDNILQGLWTENEWKKKNMEIAKAVYEVLAYLKAMDAAEPPRYSV